MGLPAPLGPQVSGDGPGPPGGRSGENRAPLTDALRKSGRGPGRVARQVRASSCGHQEVEGSTPCQGECERQLTDGPFSLAPPNQ